VIPEVIQPAEEFKLYNVELVKEDDTVHYLPDVKEITKTIVLKNTGILDLPKGAFIKATDNYWASRIFLQQV